MPVDKDPIEFFKEKERVEGIILLCGYFSNIFKVKYADPTR